MLEIVLFCFRIQIPSNGNQLIAQGRPFIVQKLKETGLPNSLNDIEKLADGEFKEMIV